MTVKLTSDKAAAVDQDYFWRPMQTCPVSAKVAEETVCDTHLPTGVKIYGTRAAKAIRERSNP